MSTFRSIEFPLLLPAALVVIDMQPCGTDPRYGLAKALETAAPGYTRYLAERLRSDVVPAINRLLDAFHRMDQPVFLTAFASRVGDGSDVRTASIRYRNEERLARTGASVILPRFDPATDIVRELRVNAGDTLLVKTSMDSFATTNLADELQRRGVQSVVVSGIYTDACVESTSRHAAELGYRVFVPEDACAAWETTFHEASLNCLGRYFARIESSDRIINILEEAARCRARVT